MKLYSGIYNAFVSSKPKGKKRLIENIARDVEGKILMLRKKEVFSKEVGDIVLTTLRKYSPGAFLGFLTYYKDISKEADIKRELKKYLRN